MRARLAFFLSLCCIFASACRDQSGAQVSRASSAVAAEPVDPPAEMKYPIVLEATPEMIEAAENARKVSDANDAACAFIEIDASLASKRPDGLGCPRPEGPVESWGAN